MCRAVAHLDRMTGPLGHQTTTFKHSFIMRFQHGTNINSHFTIEDKGCRTQEQFEAFISFFSQDQPSFLCHNPFKVFHPEESYNCTFGLFYYKGLEFFKMKITPKGKITTINLTEAKASAANQK